MYYGRLLTMDKDDYDYYMGSVSEQLLVILWTVVATCIIVGIMLAIAL